MSRLHYVLTVGLQQANAKRAAQQTASTGANPGEHTNISDDTIASVFLHSIDAAIPIIIRAHEVLAQNSPDLSLTATALEQLCSALTTMVELRKVASVNAQWRRILADYSTYIAQKDAEIFQLLRAFHDRLFGWNTQNASDQHLRALCLNLDNIVFNAMNPPKLTRQFGFHW